MVLEIYTENLAITQQYKPFRKIIFKAAMAS